MGSRKRMKDGREGWVSFLEELWSPPQTFESIAALSAWRTQPDDAGPDSVCWSFQLLKFILNTSGRSLTTNMDDLPVPQMYCNYRRKIGPINEAFNRLWVYAHISITVAALCTRVLRLLASHTTPI